MWKDNSSSAIDRSNILWEASLVFAIRWVFKWDAITSKRWRNAFVYEISYVIYFSNKKEFQICDEPRYKPLHVFE